MILAIEFFNRTFVCGSLILTDSQPIDTLIASLYGMNVGLPFVETPNDPLVFGLILVMSLLITTPLLILLRYKNLV